MGAWSDRTGNRKLCILLPIFGEFLVCISNVISTVFFYQVTVEVTMFLEAIFPAVTGYYGIFAISGTIYLLTFSYGFFYLKKCTKPGVCENEKVEAVTISELATLIKETVVVAFKKRDGNIRKKIIITLLTVAIVYGPNHGERIITYMFVRYRLKWDAVKYSMYSTYSIITHSLGALFSISVFSKRWGFHDSVLCLISIVSKLAGSILIAFVRTDLEMFMVPIVEILNATTFTSLRSMASKLVLSKEMGKMNSLFSLVETLAALFFDPTYSTLYSKTIPIFAGAVYIFSAVMTLPAIVMLIWLFMQHRLESRSERENRVNTCDEKVLNV
ncbi:unnamed protein product, partial [Iphiclides podalirius]